MIKAGMKGGPHDDVSACRCIGDFGISVFHQPGRPYRPKASPLNRVREGNISLGDQVVEQSVIDRIGLVIMERNLPMEEGKT